MAAGSLSIVTDRILEYLDSDKMEQIVSLSGLQKELLLRLKGTIAVELAPVVVDAEKKSQRDNHVRDWLTYLEDVLYDADNLLDSFSSEALQRRSMTEKKMGKQEMKKVMETLNKIVDRRKKFDLEEGSGEVVMKTDQNSWNRIRSSIKEGVHRNEDKMAIITILLNTEFEDSVEVLPVVGRAGLGKTKIAEEVFNDEAVQNHFDIQIWISVSGVFEDEKILREILVHATSRKVEDLPNDQQSQKLLLRLSLSGNRYLIVLDDVRNEDPEKWDSLKKSLEVGTKGSKILVTTRSESVSNLIKGTIRPYALSDLSEEQSWILFETIAFEQEQESNNKDRSYQIRAGTVIVQRCAGNPFAIMATAGMLRSESITKWKHFFKNEFSKIGESYNPFPFNRTSNDNAEVPRLVKLCYDHLPSPLKHCFAYCSLFPKGREIDVQTLIKLWMAQGYIVKQSGKSMEDVGYEYVLDLLGRFFFEEVERDETKNVITKCKMPNLMHDLAMSVTGEQCRFLSSMANDNSSGRTFHVWFDFDLFSTEDVMKFGVKKIRSIFWSGQSRRRYRGVPVNTIFDIITSKFRHLRALDMHASGIEIVPKSIGKLKLLKYLDLSRNEDITELPNSITELQNLQTLRLSSCFKLKKLPRDFRKLKKLRHLENDGCNNLIGLPQGISELTDLQMVSQLVVTEDSSTSHAVANKLRELAELIERLTYRNLRLKNLRHDKDVATYLKAVPSGVQSLSLEWEGHEPETKYDQTPLNKNLSTDLSADLEQWSIIGFRGITLFCPSSDFPCNLVKLSLSRCANCSYLPLVRQLSSLKVLVLDNLTNLEYILAGDSSSTTFLPILEELWLTELPKLLGWWQNTGDKLPVFDCLSKLVIEDCPKLVSMPRFPKLEKRLVLDRTSWKLFEWTMNQNTTDEEAPLSKLKNLRIVGITEFKAGEIKWAALENLQFLRFDSLPGLETLPVGLQTVSSLQELHIWRCPIKEIPEWIEKLKNLKTLVIRICPHLKKLPKEISNLKIRTLEIDDCNTLLRRCENDIGADWVKISSIPRRRLGRITRR